MHKKLSLSELARNTQHYVCHYYNSFQNPITHFDRLFLSCKRQKRHIQSEGTLFFYSGATKKERKKQLPETRSFCRRDWDDDSIIDRKSSTTSQQQQFRHDLGLAINPLTTLSPRFKWGGKRESQKKQQNQRLLWPLFITRKNNLLTRRRKLPSFLPPFSQTTPQNP